MLLYYFHIWCCNWLYCEYFQNSQIVQNTIPNTTSAPGGLQEPCTRMKAKKKEIWQHLIDIKKYREIWTEALASFTLERELLSVNIDCIPEISKV